jgi:hypothetical protein
MAVARTFIRNRISTTATTAAASKSTLLTLLTEFSMKVACRNWTFVAVIPAGSVFWIAWSASSTFWVRGTVSAPGCFWTETMTAGLPL